jgi:hypothetical protein
MSGELAACQTTAEVYVVVARLFGGLDEVDRLLQQTASPREHLRRDADQIARVGMKDLAALLRRHARTAKRARPIFSVGYQTASALIIIAGKRLAQAARD